MAVKSGRRIPTARVRNEKYWLHNGLWKILVRADGNEQAYVPVYRTGWEDGGEVEIFSLLPADGCGDTLLVQIRIYTRANFNEGKESVPHPAIISQCNIPAFIHAEPAKQRILISLLCHLEARPHEQRLIVVPDPEIEVEYLQEEVEAEREKITAREVISALREEYEEHLELRAKERTFEEWMAQGRSAYDGQEYETARECFDLAIRRDLTREAEASFWFALACLLQGELEEAENALTLLEEKGTANLGMVAATVILAQWSRMCLSPTMNDFFQYVRNVLDLPPDEHPLDFLEGFSQEWGDVPQRAIWDAIIAYLRGDPRRSLQTLEQEQGLADIEQRWLGTFWKGMAYGALDQTSHAQGAVHAALSQGMPPVLLLPLLWFRTSKAAFFEQGIEPLFRSHDLSLQVSQGLREKACEP